MLNSNIGKTMIVLDEISQFCMRSSILLFDSTLYRNLGVAFDLSQLIVDEDQT